MSEKIILNNREFEFSCWFVDGTPHEYNGIVSPIPYGNIEYLEIRDNIYSPFVFITMKIKSTRNSIEKLPGSSFKFNANSRNLIILSISPVDNPIEAFAFTGVVDQSVILSSDDSISSYTIMSIIDTKEAVLKETKVGFVYPTVDSNISVSANIKKILSYSFDQDEPGNFFSGTGFSEGVVDGLQLPQYTFPLHYNLLDAVNFLLKYNISKVLDLDSQFFLRWNLDTKQYENYSIFELFKNANLAATNLEGFTLGGQSNPLENKTTIPFGTVFVPPGNQLNNLTFSNVNFNISNTDFLSIYCSQTNNVQGQNSVSKVEFEPTLNNFTKNILNCESMKQIYSTGDGSKIMPNIDLDSGKDSKQNYKTLITPFDNEINTRVAEVQLYNAFIFQNMFISFKCLGRLYRDPGHFIVMTKTSDIGGSFDEKILGQWLVTEVCHNFEKGVYTNTFQCTKPFKVVQ